MDGQDGVIVFDLASMEVASVMALGTRDDVLSFQRVNDERLVASFGRRRSGRGEVIYTAGELYSRVAQLSDTAVDYRPLAFDEVNEIVYLAASSGDNAYGLVRYDPASRDVETLWESTDFDIYDLVMSADETAVVAVGYYADKLTYTYLDTSHPKSRLIASIQHAFPDYDIEIESTTCAHRDAARRSARRP